MSGRRIVFATIAVAVALLLFELGARYLEHRDPRVFVAGETPPENFMGLTMVYDPVLLWRVEAGRHRPHQTDYLVTDEGVRYGEADGPPDPTTPERIVFLGDSSVYGWDVDYGQCFAAVIGGQWSGGAAKRGIFNAGCPGYSSTQSRILLQINLDRWRPTRVVIAAMWSDMMRTGWTDVEMFARHSSWGYRVGGGLRQTLGHSALFRLMAALRGAPKIPPGRKLFWQTIGDETFDGPPRVDPETHADNLRAMTAMAKGIGAKVTLLILPNTWDMQGKGPSDEAEVYFRNFHRVGEQTGAIVVDMSKEYAGASRAEMPRYFVDEIHPSPEGHRVIAERILSAWR
ncbi:hypothetical protein KDL45_01805 [bacterium]|nr:hypothetical protein [bacterium]